MTSDPGCALESLKCVLTFEQGLGKKEGDQVAFTVCG